MFLEIFDFFGTSYRNCNLLHQEDDFKVHAEWNSLATSHGKSPCNGIGETLCYLILGIIKS